MKQQIAETKEKLEKTEETIIQFRVEVDTKIERVETNNQIRIIATQQETQEKLDEIQGNMSGRMTKISGEIDQVKNQVNGNKEKIENMQHIMDRLNIVRPTCSSYHTTLENRDSDNFKYYRKTLQNTAYVFTNQYRTNRILTVDC